MIETTALLARERGIEATSFADVIADSGAPRGSIYHHFPGGKAQLIEEATRWAGEVIARSLERALAGEDPVAGLRRFAATWRSVLQDSDFLAGCTIVAAAVEGDSHPTARWAAAEAFEGWERRLAESLRHAGVTAGRSRALATLVVASMEGAIVLCRAQRSTDPLERVVAELEMLLASAIDA